jgi:hypothetical protein
VRKALDKVQDKVLGLTTGATKCAAIASMEIETECDPPNIRRGKRNLKLAEKCTRLPVNHWNTTKCLHKLKTQRTFICNASELRGKYDITWKGRERERETDRQTDRQMFNDSILELLVVNITQHSWSLGENILLWGNYTRNSYSSFFRNDVSILD